MIQKVGFRKLWCLVALALLVFLFPLYRWSSALAEEKLPELTVNDFDDLGVKKPGEELRATFCIENKGTGPLEIRGFHTGCGCDRIELTKDSKSITQYPVILNHREKCTLNILHKIGLDVYGPINKKVTIYSNDPEFPEKVVVAKVKDVEKDLHVTNNNILFGPIESTNKLSESPKYIPVYSRFNKKVNNNYILIEHHGIADAKFSPDQDVKESDSITYKYTKLYKIGTILVNLKTIKPTTFNESIKCTKFDHSEFFTITVSGEIRNLFDISPSITILPRMSDSGPIFFGNLSIRKGDEKPFNITSIKKPYFIIAKNLESFECHKLTHYIKVEIDRAIQDKFRDNPNYKVKIEAKANESPSGVEIQIFAIEETNAQD